VRLIDDLLDLSRITSGKMRLNVVRVELASAVQEALEALHPAADAKGIVLRVAMDPDAGSIAADPARLQQIVWNLLMNPVKFTPRGGQVLLRVERSESTVTILVRDTGQGITPDMLPHVFERFRQADSSSTRTHGGLGLGLALVKHLVELHGGDVVAASDGDGQGASFTVTLPVAAAAPRVDAASAPRAVTSAPSAVEEVVRLDGVRVLVVDDDAESLTLVEAMLARAGAAVRTSRSAHEAMEHLRAWSPSVLVSDIGMPEEDGYSLIRRIRALAPGEGGGTPAIAMTGYGRPQDRQQAIAAGFNVYVPKPVDPVELTGLIASLAAQPSPTA
jgi:CheY-like chemotaxis protein